MKALLFSGGLDSSALAWSQRPDLCVTIDYGQRSASGELVASSALCEAMGLNHEVLRVDLSALGSGSLAGQPAANVGRAPEFWPYRNQVLVTLAAMALLPRGLRTLQIGVVKGDRHADGSPAFLEALDTLLRTQEGGVRIVAPGAQMTASELLTSSGFPLELVGLTFSCHVHQYACGQCAGCVKHREVLEAVFHSRRPEYAG